MGVLILVGLEFLGASGFCASWAGDLCVGTHGWGSDGVVMARDFWWSAS